MKGYRTEEKINNVYTESMRYGFEGGEEGRKEGRREGEEGTEGWEMGRGRKGMEGRLWK